MNTNELELKNIKLAKEFKKFNITSVSLTSVGNSIGNGYSFANKTKPLLYRNETLKDTFKKEDINVNISHFARAQYNNDEEILLYILNNTRLSEINRLCRNDSLKGDTPVKGISKEEWDEYYPLKPKYDPSINDILKRDEPGLANIVIYNGITGSFLDNITRSGNRSITYGMKRDSHFISAVFTYIQNLNRNSQSKTQIYLCGAPRILNTQLTDIFMNRKLKEIAKEYANVSYIEPISRKILYKRENQSSIPDTHYDEEEYLKLNGKIIDKISDDYYINDSLLRIDKWMYLVNKEVELGEMSSSEAIIVVEKILAESISKLIKLDIDIEILRAKLSAYIRNRFSHNFYYITDGITNEGQKNMIFKKKSDKMINIVDNMYKNFK